MLRTWRTPLIIGAVIGLILGLLLGMLLFWNVWPVQYTGAHPWDMVPESRAEYVVLAADSYAHDADYERVAGLLSSWPEDVRQRAFQDALAATEAAGRPDKTQAVNDLRLVLAIPEVPLTTEPAPTSQLGRILKVLWVFLLVLLILVVAWIVARWLLRRRAAQPAARPETVMPASRRIDEATQPVQGPAELGRWITRYSAGEDAYDESFPIETAEGEYLGECGVGISEILAGGESDKVTAFEVWLFDKGDIRTVTKVLMSSYAFRDQTLRDKLSSKGDALLAEVGIPFALETSGLKVEGSVTELEYEPQEANAGSVFRKLTVDLAASSKPETGLAEPQP